MRRAYQSELSDAEWSCLEPHLPAPEANGRPRGYPLREILDTTSYVLKSGYPWRMLPREFPPSKAVYDWFWKWRMDRTWERLNTELRERLRCRLLGRDLNPSVAIVDSQSVKTTRSGSGLALR